jgi:hypothetical protein
MLKRFFAWIGSLMRRRHLIATQTTVPAPVTVDAIIQALLALEEL